MIGASQEVIEHHIKVHARENGCDMEGGTTISGARGGSNAYLCCPSCSEPLFALVAPEGDDRPVMEILEDLATEQGWDYHYEGDD